ncbi:MAG TPA: TA system VapC family ribonuclease toxin [Terriglobales bacterium]|nr:TA system VapC family ribonuclease toxin [Terriglobales bacterium]
METVLNSPERVGFAWVALLAFMRSGTNPRALSQALSVDEATRIVSSLLERPSAVLVHPGERHWALLQRLVVDAQARGDLVTDAHLAALAIEHGAVVCTTDRDFARFPGLRWQNPLQA